MTLLKTSRGLRLSLCAVMAASSAAEAVLTHYFDHQGFDQFSAGELEHLALGNTGRLESAPGLRELARIDDPVIWDAVVASDGTIYLGTGNRGRVLRLDADGDTTVVFEPDAVMTRALALDSEGNLYVGTSPDGGIFRIPADGGRPEVFYDPSDGYIWDFQIDPRGVLWVATGIDPKLIRVPLDDSSSTGPEVWFESGDEHFTHILLEDDGSVLLGSMPRGIVYRVTGKDEGRALFRASEPEITGLAKDAEGRTLFSTYNSTARPETRRGESNLQDNELPPFVVTAEGDPELSRGSASGSISRESPPRRGGSSGSLYRVDEAGIALPVWQSRDEGILSVLGYGANFQLIGTNQGGRIYAVSNHDDWQLIQSIPDGGSVQKMLVDPLDPGAILVFTGNPAAVYRLGGKPQESGLYTSEVVDGKQVARWGAIEVVTDGPAGLSLETRGGNTDTPDSTWSGWTAVEPVSQTPMWRGMVADQPARYLQYRVRIAPESSGGIHRIRGYFQLPNGRPMILRMEVLPFAADLVANPGGNPFLDLANASNPKAVEQFLQSELPRYQLKRIAEDGAFSAVWRTYDPNGDALEFDLFIRAIGTEDWIPLYRGLDQPFARINTRGLADGIYQIRLTASDRADNGDDLALESSFTSDLILIDNTAPVVEGGEEPADGVLRLLARDQTNRIYAAYLSVDGGEFRPLRPKDGIFDSTEELFEIPVAEMEGKAVLVEVYDESGNAAVWTRPASR